MSAITYYPGGYDPSAPAQNMAQQWDDGTQTYTSWSQAGDVTTTRAYTTEEAAAAAATAAIAAATANQSDLQNKASNALVNNQTFLDQANPLTETPTYPLSTAEQEILVEAVIALGTQVIALTRQVDALIYLQLEEFASTAGT